MSLNFIFMLTEHDKTIPDAILKLQEVLKAGAGHIGFKDIGLPFEDLKILAENIRGAGAKLYLEVVSLDEASEIRSAKVAMELNVDYLMGGTRPNVIVPLVKNHFLKYYPFPGKIIGHPSKLIGTIDEIVESAVLMASIDGVDGLDLLAYRFKGNVPKLMRAVCESISKPVVIAGSINSKEQITEIYLSHATGFTVGTAAFNGSFPATEKGLLAQVSSIASINNLVQTQLNNLESPKT